MYTNLLISNFQVCVHRFVKGTGMYPTDVQREFVLFNVKTKDNHPWSVYALIRPLHVICGLMGNCWFCFPFNLHHCVYFLGYNTYRGKVAVTLKKDGVNGFAAT